MAAVPFKKRQFLEPPESSNSEQDEGVGVAGDLEHRRKRNANVYDAVAGRVTTTLPLGDRSGSGARPSHHRRPAANDLRDPTLAPEEVLFRRAGAPIRYAEKDIYHAHERLPDGGRDVLPDGDMLKAIHQYAAHFYDSLASRQQGPQQYEEGRTQAQEDAARRRGKLPVTKARGVVKMEGVPLDEKARADRSVLPLQGGRNIDERSMDETALLAVGILLEEVGREALGRRGDLVFTEGAAAPEPDGPAPKHGTVGLIGGALWRSNQKRAHDSPSSKPEQTADTD